MDKSLLTLLVCPQCKGKLHYSEEQQELICLSEGLGYPIRDNIPVMLIDEARQLSMDEVEALQ
ncbi:MAG: Trm112 family protein [Gammaproteobacteria bacterium]